MATSHSHFTKEELLKKLKSQKMFVIVQAVLIFLMIILAVLSTIDKGITFLTFLPLFFVPMEIIMILELKKIKKELANRN